MTHDPQRETHEPRRPEVTRESSTATAVFIGAFVLLALVFGGVYFFMNENQRLASDMTINNTPITRPAEPPAATPPIEEQRSPPAPAPSTPQ